MRCCVKNAGPRLLRRTARATDQERRQDEHGADRHRAVERGLDDAAAAVELRLLDLQQRQAGDGTDGQPRAGHLDERRGHHQVGAGRLELPRQPAQLLGAEVGAGEHGDSVGVGEADGLGHRPEAADDGDAALHQGRDADRASGRQAATTCSPW